MLRDRSREKLIQAILYFAHNTLYLGKIKLFKLLYLLDFEHFRETGRSVTGMEYRAWKMGPVPIELVQQWDDLDEDLAAAIEIQPAQVIDYVRECVVPLADFDPQQFSKRELRLMHSIAAQYRDTMSDRMIDVTHAENGAWHKAWEDGAGSNRVIEYALALTPDDPSREAILDAAAEYKAIQAAQGR